uniref:Uncharacterized protein n=1 Tax=Rhizophora mucronata TaxID=61149 RepID=A0A2P2Q851_RHIMU
MTPVIKYLKTEIFFLIIPYLNKNQEKQTQESLVFPINT